MAEDFDELLVVDEWIKHDVDVETFCAVAAPAVGFRADVAATENAEVAWEFDEFLDNLIFVYAAKQAEILDLITEVSGSIGTKIIFKFNALRVLMVDIRALHVALVCGGFVAQNDIRFVVEVGDDVASEGEAGREWNVAIIEALLV